MVEMSYDGDMNFKIKLTPCTPWRALWGIASMAPLFLYLGTGGGCAVSFSARPRFTLEEKTRCVGGWVCPTADWARRVDEKSSAFVGDRTPVPESLVSHYTDSYPAYVT
jgi:hypothetical protein